ncbi:MAG: hypothetical protein OCD76_25730 [Reichenbachiella sp.]
MKNRFLTLTISAIIGTMVIYGLLEFQSFIHRTNNPEYAEMINEVAELGFSDLAFVFMFFFVIYPFQFIVLTLKQRLERRGLSEFRTAFTIMLISTFLYSIGFTIVFRSAHLGTSDTIQTFGMGTLIFGMYFLINLSTHYFISNIGTKRIDNA